MAVRILREGRVVESPSGPVVRFASGCEAAAGSACCMGGSRERELPAHALGLGRDAAAGRRVTLSVGCADLARLAAIVFAAPLAALVVGAWAGTAAAPVAGLTADALGAFAGLTGLGVTWWLIARSGGALVRMLRLEARLY